MSRPTVTMPTPRRRQPNRQRRRNPSRAKIPQVRSPIPTCGQRGREVRRRSHRGGVSRSPDSSPVTRTTVRLKPGWAEPAVTPGKATGPRRDHSPPQAGGGETGAEGPAGNPGSRCLLSSPPHQPCQGPGRSLLSMNGEDWPAAQCPPESQAPPCRVPQAPPGSPVPNKRPPPAPGALGYPKVRHQLGASFQTPVPALKVQPPPQPRLPGLPKTPSK